MEQVNFLMKITDVFNITGRGKIVLGKILHGGVSVNDKIKVVSVIEKVHIKVDEFEMVIQLIEGFRKYNLPSAKKGDSVGLLLSGQEKFRLKKGLYLVAGDGEIELNRLMNEKGSR